LTADPPPPRPSAGSAQCSTTYAVELEALEFNPIDKLRVRSRRKKIAEMVDRRVVVNQRQALELPTAVSYVGRRGRVGRGERLVAFFACMYFAGLRPGEALGLREQEVGLPTRSGSGGKTWRQAPRDDAGRD
jgi:integrase